jgi:hypothetical protein
MMLRPHVVRVGAAVWSGSPAERLGVQSVARAGYRRNGPGWNFARIASAWAS